MAVYYDVSMILGRADGIGNPICKHARLFGINGA